MGFQLRVRVVDSVTKQPIAKADVVADSADNKIPDWGKPGQKVFGTQMTNGDGRATLIDWPGPGLIYPSVFELTARHPGYTAAVSAVVAFDGTKDVEVSLEADPFV